MIVMHKISDGNLSQIMLFVNKYLLLVLHVCLFVQELNLLSSAMFFKVNNIFLSSLWRIIDKILSSKVYRILPPWNRINRVLPFIPILFFIKFLYILRCYPSFLFYFIKFLYTCVHLYKHVHISHTRIIPHISFQLFLLFFFFWYILQVYSTLVLMIYMFILNFPFVL